MGKALIETERLILRKPVKSDASQLYSSLNDASIETYVPSLYMNSYWAALGYIEIIDTSYDFTKSFSFVIIEKQSNKIIGVLDAYLTVNKTIPISCAIKTDAKSYGYGTEATKAFILAMKKRFYSDTNYENIVFSVREDNKASNRVMEKLNISIHHRKEDYNYYYVSLKKELPF